MTTNSTKSNHPSGSSLNELWLNQFERADLSDAKRLLASIHNVTADEFHEALIALLHERIDHGRGPVGFYVESERRHRKGRVHRLFKEPRRKQRRAYGSGPPIISPAKTVDPEVGSEGLVAHLVTQVIRQNKGKATIHPGPDTIRKRRIRRFILVTDFIGTGNRARRYLEAAWQVRSVRSWWSTRRKKGLSFEVVAYSATEAGKRIVEQHSSQPKVRLVRGCPTIYDAFIDIDTRARILDLCSRYGSFGSGLDPLGYGGIGALISFAHGMPNNAPILFHKQSQRTSKPWAPLYPARVTSGRREASVSLARQREAVYSALWGVTKERILKSPRFVSAPPKIRDALQVLITVDRVSRTNTTISARTLLPMHRVNAGLSRAKRYGWIDADNRILDQGRRELTRLASPVQHAVEFEPQTLYVPKSLRAPKVI